MQQDYQLLSLLLINTVGKKKTFHHIKIAGKSLKQIVK